MDSHPSLRMAVFPALDLSAFLLAEHATRLSGRSMGEFSKLLKISLVCVSGVS